MADNLSVANVLERAADLIEREGAWTTALLEGHGSAIRHHAAQVWAQHPNNPSNKKGQR